MNVNIGFFEVSALSALLPLVFGLFHVKSMSKPLRIILCFIFISLFLDALNFFAAYITQNNSALINLYSFLQTLIIGFYFLSMYRKNDEARKTHLLIFIIFLVTVSLLLLDNHNNGGRFNIHSLCASSVGIILHSSIFMINNLKQHLTSNLSEDQHFFVASSLLIYHSCVFTIFLTSGLFNTDSAIDIWKVKLVAYIIFNIFIAIAMNIDRKNNVV